MAEILNKIVDESAMEVRFACDLQACHGACCTMRGVRGAPLRDSEVKEITRWYPAIRSLLPRQHIDVIETDGLVQGSPGDFSTTCVDEQACVFVYYEGPVAKCAFERAFHEGRIPWRKPISCHLFPVRVHDGTLEELRFEYIPECRPALHRGMEQNIFLSDFLQDSLTRAFGPEWYEAFRQRSEDLRRRRTSPLTA